MAKELSKVGIVTGNDIKAPHVTQSVDAFTGLDAYDITISGSLEVTGSISTDSTVYANALNLEGGNIQYYPADDLLKFGDNITIGVGAGASGFASDIEIKSDGNEGYITSNVSNLTLQSGGGDTIIRNTKTGKNIILQPDATLGGASGGVLISGSSPNVSLDVRGPITGSSNISASGDIYGDNFIAANNITSSANISASGDIYGNNFIAANNITSSANISASGYVTANTITGSFISASSKVITKEIGVVGDAGIKLGDWNDPTNNNEGPDVTLFTNGSGEISMVKNGVNVMAINSTQNIVFGGGYNITASANISASGDIYGKNLYVRENLTLTSPNSTTPSAGKVLTAVDGTGKTEWATGPNQHQAFNQTSALSTSPTYQGGTGERTIMTITLPSTSKSYILTIHFSVEFVEADGTDSSVMGPLLIKIKEDGNQLRKIELKQDIVPDFESFVVPLSAYFSKPVTLSGQVYTFTVESEHAATDYFVQNAQAHIVGIPYS